MYVLSVKGTIMSIIRFARDIVYQLAIVVIYTLINWWDKEFHEHE